MPINPYQVNQIKEAILSYLSARGPSLPVHLARNVRTDPLFVNAFLSELYKDGKVKMSNMKVGSSSLYYLEGQEAQLENFVEHLNPKEKEAFFLLKEKKVLEDEKLPPAIRVALRSIKDFAFPMNLSPNPDEKRIVWRYFLLPENEVLNLISETKASTNEPLPLKEEPKKETPQENMINVPIIKTLEKPVENKKEKKSKKSDSVSNSEFALKIKDYLNSKDIELLSIIEEKRKELVAKVRIDTLFGKQEYLLTAKEKKKITETDLALALQKAQAEKMPSLLIHPGELDKKAIIYLQNWKNLLKIEKINL